MKSILITGATGFIGSNITKALLHAGYKVYATCRSSSSFERCDLFREKIEWINTDKKNWQKSIKKNQPDQLIHSAWGGITAKDRNNWELQIRNFWLSKEYFDLAKESGIKRIIAFGSQAEYGEYKFPVNEESVLHPDDAYGAIKTLTANYLRQLFDNVNGEWYWIRFFSVFGEGENSGWLIPAVISALLKNKPISLTPCEQVYNYLYIEDLISQIVSVVQNEKNKSGIYNLCNSKSIVLRELLIQIAGLMGISQNLLQFGGIPYRPGQYMFIAGDNSKFSKSFPVNKEDLVGLTKGLTETIQYYRKSIL